MLKCSGNGGCYPISTSKTVNQWTWLLTHVFPRVLTPSSRATTRAIANGRHCLWRPSLSAPINLYPAWHLWCTALISPKTWIGPLSELFAPKPDHIHLFLKQGTTFSAGVSAFTPAGASTVATAVPRSWRRGRESNSSLDRGSLRTGDNCEPLQNARFRLVQIQILWFPSQVCSRLVLLSQFLLVPKQWAKMNLGQAMTSSPSSVQRVFQAK